MGELIGGSQREDRYDVLKARIEATGMDAGPYEQYLDIRKVGAFAGAACALHCLHAICLYCPAIWLHCPKI